MEERITGNPDSVRDLAMAIDRAANWLSSVAATLDVAAGTAGTWEGIAANSFIACVARLRQQFPAIIDDHRGAADVLSGFGEEFAAIKARQPARPTVHIGSFTDPDDHAAIQARAEDAYDAGMRALRAELEAHADAAAAIVGSVASGAGAATSLGGRSLDAFLTAAISDVPITDDDATVLSAMLAGVRRRLDAESAAAASELATQVSRLIDEGDVDAAADTAGHALARRLGDPTFVTAFFLMTGAARLGRLLDDAGQPGFDVVVEGLAAFTRDHTGQDLAARFAAEFTASAGIERLAVVLDSGRLRFGEELLVAAGNRALTQNVGWTVAGAHQSDHGPVYEIDVVPALDVVMAAIARDPMAAARVLTGTTSFSVDLPREYLRSPVHEARTVSNASIVLRAGNEAGNQVPPFRPDGIGSVVRAGTSRALARREPHLHENALVAVAEALGDDMVRPASYRWAGLGHSVRYFSGPAENPLAPAMAEVVADVYADNSGRAAAAARSLASSIEIGPEHADPIGVAAGDRPPFDLGHVETVLEAVFDADHEPATARVLAATRAQVHASIAEATRFDDRSGPASDDGVAELDGALALSGAFIEAYDSVNDAAVVDRLREAIDARRDLETALSLGGTLVAAVAGPIEPALVSALIRPTLEGAAAAAASAAVDVPSGETGAVFDDLAAGRAAHGNLADLVVFYSYENAVASQDAPGAQAFVEAMREALPPYVFDGGHLVPPGTVLDVGPRQPSVAQVYGALGDGRIDAVRTGDPDAAAAIDARLRPFLEWIRSQR